MKTLKSNVSEVYKAQVDCLKDSESVKVKDLVRLHKTMKKQCKKN